MAHLFGRQAFVELLISEGVTHLFGNPGTTELPIMEALPDYPQLKFVLGLQESVVIGMADGFARASDTASTKNGLSPCKALTDSLAWTWTILPLTTANWRSQWACVLSKYPTPLTWTPCSKPAFKVANPISLKSWCPTDLAINS